MTGNLIENKNNVESQCGEYVMVMDVELRLRLQAGGVSILQEAVFDPPGYGKSS